MAKIMKSSIFSCAICLDDSDSLSEFSVLNCHHMFHWNCLLQWLTMKDECPICRAWTGMDVPESSKSHPNERDQYSQDYLDFLEHSNT
jgi:hypothetical protein